MFPTMTQGVAGNGKLRKSSWTTSTDAEAVFFVSLAASFASTSTAVIALPKWDIG
jgi:putative alpha-1,2-mannosidase